MINHYVVLEIPNFSDQPVIKKAYRTLSKKYHPDVNKDPFASSYFLKINEAYNFLMDDNKRMLLHQFLYIQEVSKATKTNSQAKYQEKYTQNPQQDSVQVEPIIHLFSADKKHFVLNDHILLQWNVSQCKSININVFGNVDFSGTHYLKIDHFAEEIIVLMTVVGFNDKEYKYQIKLQYSSKNPTRKAFQKIKSQYPDADEIHFKKETFFGLHARINKTEFKNRMILLSLFFFPALIFFICAPLKTFSFFILLILSWIIFAQCYKRIHDIDKLKNKVYLLFLPFYNLFLLKELFVLDSEKNASIFGVVPQKETYSFKNWIFNDLKKLNKQLTLLQKMSMATFVLLMFLVTIKTIIPFKETFAELTSHYTTSSKQSKGTVYYDYFLVFNNNISVNVSEDYFHEVVVRKTYDTFKIALKNSYEAEYVILINSKNNDRERLNLGLLQSNNPALIIAVLLFLSQLYVWRNLTAPAEQKFANAYMVFVMIIYIYVIFKAIF